MIGSKYLKLVLNKYKAFHVFYNKKWDSYYRKKGITPTIIDYYTEYPVDTEKALRKANDYWMRHVICFGIILFPIIVVVIMKLFGL